MSMQTYPVIDYGLYVTELDLHDYAERNDYDAFECLLDIDGFNFYSGVEGEAFLVMDDGESFDIDDVFAIASLNRYPTLFTQAYENKEQALQELKDNYSKYLPNNFDFNSMFVRLDGTISI